MYTAAVVTVSDSAFSGQREDRAGPEAIRLLEAAGYEVQEACLVPDEEEAIREILVSLADEVGAALIVTTGGTGFSPRDVTPEATAAVCQRLAPGIPEAMRAASLAVTPRGMLSRGTAGLRGGSLIVNLPGSPKAVRENLEAVLPALGHGLAMLRDGPADCAAGAPGDSASEALPAERRNGMYEYKVETYKVKDAEEAMNRLAQEGWRVITVSPNISMGYGLVVAYERKRNQA